MTVPSSQILVCTEKNRVCVRILGRATVAISVGLKDLLNRMLESNVDHFELELSECQSMDSTFLGVLCGFACRYSEMFHRPDARPILLNANKQWNISPLRGCSRGCIG